jgi:hypothetical protein
MPLLGVMVNAPLNILAAPQGKPAAPQVISCIYTTLVYSKALTS